MKIRTQISTIALGIAAACTFGAETDTTATPASPAQRLDAYSAALEKQIAGFMHKDMLHEADLAVKARARLEATRPSAEKKPRAKETLALLTTCSLLVEAATVQLQALQAEAEARTLLSKLKDKRGTLNETHASILEIERSHASKLKSELDEEKRRAAKLRNEAERKFNELQSELISVNQDARGTIISMSDILFDVGKASLTADLKTNLAKIAGILTVFKTSKVVVEGHTDNQGTAEYNQTLSEERALNVMEFLVEQGVAPARLTSMGYGFTKPVADNATREGRQKNRRVDLVIRDKKHQKQADDSKDW
jgi:outer membrane protein OmpA-like peptidoglycan-associated protein